MADFRLHKRFSLNGISFDDKSDLILYSKELDFDTEVFIRNWFDTNDYIKVQTSGSTGIPKTIKLKKEHMINSAKATGIYFDLPMGTSALLCMSVKYIAGKMMLVRAMVLGWQLDCIAPNSNPLEKIEKEYDFSAMIPLQVFNSIDKILLIKKLIIGGGVVSNSLQNRIQNLSNRIYATYGMTETITHIAVKRLNKLTEDSFYEALNDVKFSQDQRKCLVIEAPNVSSKSIVTNDLVELKSSIKFKWLGRFDNIINTGGIKVIPEEIENKISHYFSNNRFFIGSQPDEKLGEKVILLIEGDLDDFHLDEIKCKLRKYEIPKEMFFVPKFSLTETDKIDRSNTLSLLNQ